MYIAQTNFIYSSSFNKKYFCSFINNYVQIIRNQYYYNRRGNYAFSHMMSTTVATISTGSKHL